MKIASFNINGIVRRLENLLAWLAEARPDVVCLQELKAGDGELPREPIAAAGYGALWAPQRPWNGVAILARGAEPIATRRELPGDPRDGQRRYLEAAVGGIIVASIYAPNGNPQPGPKFDYKLAWLDRLRTHAKSLMAAGVPVVLAGDYNVVPEPRDIYPSASYADNALVQPAPREKYRALLDDGWTDAVQKIHPDATVFTFWDYRRNRFARDAGLRLDHLLLSPGLVPRLVSAGVDRTVREKPDASDHAPVWIELA